jgi:hypothetical protein
VDRIEINVLAAGKPGSAGNCSKRAEDGWMEVWGILEVVAEDYLDYV